MPGPIIWFGNYAKVLPTGGLVDHLGNPIGGGSSSPTTTRGDMIYRGASADSRLAIGNAYQFLRSNGTDPEWVDPVNRSEYGWIEDFLETGITRFSWVNAGASISYSDAALSVPNNLHPGIWKATISNPSDLGLLLQTTLVNGSLLFGNGALFCEWMVSIGALSDSTDTTILRVGLGVAYGGDYRADFYDGAYFYYTHSNNSGRWSARTGNNWTWTQLDSSVTVDANTWYRLTLVGNPAGTSVEFFIDGTSIGTISTNIPTAYPQGIQPACQFQKTAGSAARHMVLDYYSFYKRTTR